MGLRVSGSRRREFLFAPLIRFLVSRPTSHGSFPLQALRHRWGFSPLLHVTSFAADISEAPLHLNVVSIYRWFFLFSSECDEHCYVAPVLLTHEDSTDSLIPYFLVFLYATVPWWKIFLCTIHYFDSWARLYYCRMRITLTDLFWFLMNCNMHYHLTANLFWFHLQFMSIWA